jgi:hypothetical protein
MALPPRQRRVRPDDVCISGKTGDYAPKFNVGQLVLNKKTSQASKVESIRMIKTEDETVAWFYNLRGHEHPESVLESPTRDARKRYVAPFEPGELVLHRMSYSFGRVSSLLIGPDTITMINQSPFGLFGQELTFPLDEISPLYGPGVLFTTEEHVLVQLDSVPCLPPFDLIVVTRHRTPSRLLALQEPNWSAYRGEIRPTFAMSQIRMETLNSAKLPKFSLEDRVRRRIHKKEVCAVTGVAAVCQVDLAEVEFSYLISAESGDVYVRETELVLIRSALGENPLRSTPKVVAEPAEEASSSETLAPESPRVRWPVAINTRNVQENWYTLRIEASGDVTLAPESLIPLQTGDTFEVELPAMLLDIDAQIVGLASANQDGPENLIVQPGVRGSLLVVALTSSGYRPLSPLVAFELAYTIERIASRNP